MKLLSWNINGVRASNRETSLKNLLDSLNADVICLQETKITRNMLTDDIANIDGYFAFFSCSRKKEGYSGVATYCKKETACPISAEEGITGTLVSGHGDCIGCYDNPVDYSDELLRLLDSEGRCIITEHELPAGKRVCILNVYCPRADIDDKERYLFKMRYYELLWRRCQSLMNSGRHVLLVGDLNVSHRKLDHCDPEEGFYESPSRQWLDSVLLPLKNRQFPIDTETGEKTKENDAENRLVDVFRMFHGDVKNAFTCWNTQKRARETNYGTRIDYILADSWLCNEMVTDCEIRPDIYGSDHCPVQAHLKVSFKKPPSVPKLCAVFLPETRGKQSRIHAFFTNAKRKSNECDITTTSAKRRKRAEDKRSLMTYFTRTEINKQAGDNPRTAIPSNETCSITTANTSSRTTKKNCSGWKEIFSGPGKLPSCPGHREKCVLRTVKKSGPNFGRQFYTCNRPTGHKNNKEAECGFFLWKYN